METPEEAEIEANVQKIRRLSNRGRYREAYALTLRWTRRHPEVLRYAYLEAVFSAEDTSGDSPARAKARRAAAAKKLRRILGRMRGQEWRLRLSVRNEYYWFSGQPYKQYRLGCELVAQGHRNAYYCQGVGAERLARRYGLAGRRGLCLRWAKISERAWTRYFRAVSDWYNSYLFYAMALGYQGRKREMEQALAKAARISGKPHGWEVFRNTRQEVDEVLRALADREPL